MAMFTRVFDGDIHVQSKIYPSNPASNANQLSLANPAKLNPLASCFKPRALRSQSEGATLKAYQDKLTKTQVVEKTVTFYTPNPAESSGLVAYVNQRFCTVSRRDAQLLELLAPGPPLPSHLQPACSYCHKRSPKICWHPFKDNLGRIICPLIGYKLAVLETYRKKHPSYQAIRSVHRRLVTGQKRSLTPPGLHPENRSKLQYLNELNSFRDIENMNDMKLKRKCLRYEAERQSLEADYFKKLQECEKAYNSKSTGEVLSYMPVSERIASRSLRSAASLNLSKLSSISSKDSKTTDGARSGSAKLGNNGYSSHNSSSDGSGYTCSSKNGYGSEKFPQNMDAYVESVLANDDSCLSHITGSVTFDGSISSQNGSNVDCSTSVKLQASDYNCVVSNRNRVSKDNYFNSSFSLVLSDASSSESENSFIFSLLGDLQKISADSGSKKFTSTEILSALQFTLLDKVDKDDIWKDVYRRTMDCVLDRCSVRKDFIRKYLVDNFYNDSMYQPDVISLAAIIANVLPLPQTNLRRLSFWIDLEHIITIAWNSDGNIDGSSLSTLKDRVVKVLNSFGGEDYPCPVRGVHGLTESKYSQNGAFEITTAQAQQDLNNNCIFTLPYESKKYRNILTCTGYEKADLGNDVWCQPKPMNAHQASAPSDSLAATWAGFTDSAQPRLSFSQVCSKPVESFNQTWKCGQNEQLAQVSVPKVPWSLNCGEQMTFGKHFQPEPSQSLQGFKTALLTLKLLDYFFDNCHIFSTHFHTEDVQRMLASVSVSSVQIAKAVEMLDCMVDTDNDGIFRPETRWQKPNFEKVKIVDKIWSSYDKRGEHYSLW
ncbi:uncharacterized protein LOC108665039 [Hyalella azteca]|uniref:Uncharacterized protein LOC108665039 n=1 Tax=Hyalella azteca TaxID=294128 RepID=A0A8B7N185_HYAAZ|nr:uncharacterized protein LOC108665039 [Hyalella azteca]